MGSYAPDSGPPQAPATAGRLGRAAAHRELGRARAITVTHDVFKKLHHCGASPSTITLQLR